MLASWSSNLTSIVRYSNCVSARSCSFWPSCTFSCSFSTKKFWSSKSRLDFFKLAIDVDAMALYFFKTMGLEEIVEFVHFEWHRETSLRVLSLFLHNSNSLPSSFSKHFFRWIRVVTQEFTSDWIWSFFVCITDFFGSWFYSALFTFSNNFFTNTIWFGMKTFNSFMLSRRKNSSSCPFLLVKCTSVQ